MDKLKTIVWDVDDVLNDLMGSWFLLWRQEHPGCGAAYEDLKENPPHEVLGVSMDSYLESLDEFRFSSFFQNLAPIKEVRDWFFENGSSFRHIALTAVPLRAASLSAQWVLRNFGTWIRTFHFVPSKRKEDAIPQYDRDKTDVLQRLGAVDFFIDDNAEYVATAQEAGINALLFPRPWNHSGVSINATLAGLQIY